MARRVNIMMDEDSWRVIREWSRTSGRRDASARMDALRARLPAVETDRIVRWIRAEREQRLP